MVICITGMHRSGTSLTASWLERCGLKIHDGSVWGAGDGNPRGHFEDRDFVDLHVAAILKIDPSSHGWRLFDDQFHFFDTIDRSRACELVRRRDATADLWGWKDPRTVVYLEQWKKLVTNFKSVIVWRNCADVLYSLVRRSWNTKCVDMKMNCMFGKKLWECHNNRICRYQEKYSNDSILVPLRRIIANSELVLERVNKKFNVNIDHVPIASIFDPEQLHCAPSIFSNLLFKWYFRNSSLPLEKRLQELSEF